jgi:BirA family biotin operon repressor/biotin-[acetyl-CoA-carboxylase] ligase
VTNQLDKRRISEIIGSLRRGRLDQDSQAAVVDVIQRYKIPAQLTSSGKVIWDPAFQELDPEFILDVLPVEIQKRIVLIESLDVTDSTNEYLLNKPIEAEGFRVCLAELQLAGRGRRGKNWLAGYGQGLLLSVSYLEDGGIFSGSLALQIGLYLRSALSQLARIDFDLKWPNDILFNNAKVAGILVEAKAGKGGSRVVIGIGINYSPPNINIDSQIVPTSLSAVAGELLPDRNLLASAILQTIFEAVSDYRVAGFDYCEWNKCDIYKDTEVILEQSGLVKTGMALGTDADGNYQIQTETGLISVSSSNASLRPQI